MTSALHPGTLHPGGCLCGAIRYETTADPVHVTICHCRFCQRATGGAYMVEPIFRLEDLKLSQGSPALYERRSDGSGKMVRVHFCAACGTKLWLTFERFPGVAGLYAGTFDDPAWFDIGPANARQIFTGLARPDSILMPGVPAFHEHTTTNDGAPLQPTIHAAPHMVRGRPVT